MEAVKYDCLLVSLLDYSRFMMGLVKNGIVFIFLYTVAMALLNLFVSLDWGTYQIIVITLLLVIIPVFYEDIRFAPPQSYLDSLFKGEKVEKWIKAQGYEKLKRNLFKSKMKVATYITCGIFLLGIFVHLKFPRFL